MKFKAQPKSKKTWKDSPRRVGAFFELDDELLTVFHFIAKANGLRPNALIKQMVEHCLRENMEKK